MQVNCDRATLLTKSARPEARMTACCYVRGVMPVPSSDQLANDCRRGLHACHLVGKSVVLAHCCVLALTA